MRGGRGRWVIAWALAGCLLSTAACTSSTPPAPQPPVSPTGAPVDVDESAKLVVSPVDFGGVRVVTATFSTADAGRPAVLQKQTPSGWQDAATGEEDDSGAVTFQLNRGSDGDVYRAVATEVTGDEPQPAVATPDGSAKQQWRNVLSSDFSGSDLDSKYWSPRGTGSYHAGGRQCSAPYPANVVVGDDQVQLTVTKETSAANVAAAKAAGCKQDGVYRNAMIGTEQKFSITQGVVAARIRFAEGQGMHGSVWLQSYEKAEIDLIESYGYGRGTTSVIHIDGERYPSANSETYVNTTAVKQRDWWSQFHVFSVEWDDSQVVFRVDGTETKRITRDIPLADYFVVISMLSSDWEQKRFTNPVRNADDVTPTKLPQTMAVDWVKAWTPS
jgi:beta-glucanase (GH16 family)